MTNEHVLVKGLSVKFEKPILQNVFFKLKKGEFVSIVGKSGAGKTTFLNALTDLVKFEGEIKRPKKTALVFQNNSLFPWMTVEENIVFGAEKNSEAVSGIVARIGLGGKEEAYPSQLSSGQQQRVAIGRALLAQPELLLLDEPFASLDSFTRLQMQEWIMEILGKNSGSVLLVTHDVDEAILLSDRVLVLKNQTIENEFFVPFIRPRKSFIRYASAFQDLKRQILDQY